MSIVNAVLAVDEHVLEALKQKAREMVMEQSYGENFSQVCWLESRSSALAETIEEAKNDSSKIVCQRAEFI